MAGKNEENKETEFVFGKPSVLTATVKKTTAVNSDLFKSPPVVHKNSDQQRSQFPLLVSRMFLPLCLPLWEMVAQLQGKRRNFPSSLIIDELAIQLPNRVFVSAPSKILLYYKLIDYR